METTGLCSSVEPAQVLWGVIEKVKLVRFIRRVRSVIWFWSRSNFLDKGGKLLSERLTLNSFLIPAARQLPNDAKT